MSAQQEVQYLKYEGQPGVEEQPPATPRWVWFIAIPLVGFPCYRLAQKIALALNGDAGPLLAVAVPGLGATAFLALLFAFWKYANLRAKKLGLEPGTLAILDGNQLHIATPNPRTLSLQDVVRVSIDPESNTFVLHRPGTREFVRLDLHEDTLEELVTWTNERLRLAVRTTGAGQVG